MSDKHSSIAEIEGMIREEPDAQKRSILLVLMNMTTSIHNSIRVLDDIEKKFSKQLKDHEEKIDAHDDLVIKGQTAWKVLAWVFGGIAAFLLALAGYGGKFIYDLNKAVIEQAVVLPRLESIVNEVRLQRETVIENHEAVKQQAEVIQDQSTAIQDQGSKLEEINKDVDKIKSKKVIQASKP